MTPDGASPPGVEYMLPPLTDDEVHEARLAIKARARANGSGTKPHELCKSILRKLDDAEHHPAPSANGTHQKKIAGVDSSKWKEY